MYTTNSIYIIALLLLFPSVYGCGWNKFNTYDEYRQQTIDARDSTFVLYTIKEWRRQDWYTWRNYARMYKMTNEQVEYFWGGVFYSPDRRKIIVWVGEKIPNAATLEIYNEKEPEVNRLCPMGEDTVYMMTAVIGYRDSINQLWKLYPLDLYSVDCSQTKEIAINIMGKYFFEQMKHDAVYVSRQSLKEEYGGSVRYDLDQKVMKIKGRENSNILKDIGYSLHDKDFWDKSLIWQRGATIEGYYDFQLFGTKPHVLPEIDYPKEILELY